MAIKQGGTIVIDDSRNIVSANSIMMNGDFTSHPGEGPNIAWGVLGAFLSTFNNPNAFSTSTNDYFGSKVAISGNYAIVGAYGEDDAGGTGSGKAYIFNVSTGALLFTLNNPNAYGTSGGDSFGQSVAISDNYAIVGAPEEDDAGGTGSGKAYMFDVPTGTLLWTLDDPNAYSTSSGDNFGISVAISGNYAIVGANGEDDAGGTGSGKVYVYNVATRALLFTLDNPNAYSTSFNDQFGYNSVSFMGNAIAVSGNYAIVGAYREDDIGGSASGKAYIYNVTTGALLWTLNNPNAYSTSADDYFGYSVAISGNYAIVGANFEGDAGGVQSGKAYIYNVTTGALLFTLNNPNSFSTSASDNFGCSVGISGNYAIVGADQEDDAGGSSSGKAYIYNVTTGALLFTINNPNAYGTSAIDAFGSTVAIDGNYAIVGAFNESDVNGTTSGKAYTFALNTTYRTGKPLTTASDFGYVAKNNSNHLRATLYDIYGYGAYGYDNFGTSVSMSGNYAIVGANGDAALGGAYSGRAYIYNVTTGALVMILSNPNVYSTVVSDNFGSSVAISSNYAIVAASGEDISGGGIDPGIAYIYSIATGALLWTLDNPSPLSNYAYFGGGLAISDTYAIVGDRNNDDAGSNSGKVYIYSVATGALLFTLNNPNAYGTSTNDYFGHSVAISGNYLIVGAPYEFDISGTYSGKAYIYNVTTGALLLTLNNPNAYGTSDNDTFGWSVAVDGNYAIVGAYQEADAGGSQSGKAYIFNVTTGTLLWTLNNPNAYSTSASDYFGFSVAISGNYAIVGATQEDDVRDPAGSGNAGKAYVFNVTTGALVYTIDDPNYDTSYVGDRFGTSVSMSGNYAIIGAPGEVYPLFGSPGAGAAYIFNVNSTYKLTNVEEIQLANGMKISADNKLLQQSVPGGALLKTFDNPNAYDVSTNDKFGWSVAISGNYAIVGAYYEADTGGPYSGKAYIFNVTTGALLWTLNNPNAYGASTFDFFGQTVAISGNYAIVAAIGDADVDGSYSGKAYIFNVTTGALLWTLNNPNAYSTGQQDQFGWSVAISGNYAIVGAYSEDDAGGSLSGKAYIYNVTTGALLFTLNNPTAYSTSQNDQFGISVAISGNYAIVGAHQEADAVGTYSGKAYIYNVTTGALLFTLNNPNAYGTSTTDYFGYSVSISGNYAIVGAYGEDDAGGTDSGKAHIYNVTTGALLFTLNNPTAYSTSLNDNFGRSVAISGNYAIVGAYPEDDAGGSDSGKAYIYSATTGALLYTLNNPNAYSTGANDQFGFSVAISDNYAIVSAPQEDDAGGGLSGKAYLFAVQDLTYLDRLVQMVS